LKKFIFIFFCFFAINVSASHIVGGEIIYDDLGGGNYRITLKVYRDCLSQAPFNGTGGISTPAYLTVYDGAKNLIGLYDIGSPTITSVPAVINSTCIATPNNVCVEQGLYTYTLNLPPLAGAYDVIYQVCCRNATILNIVGPGSKGATYYTHIPGPEVVAVNSSPRFFNLPPSFVCRGLKFTFDHSATDPDGDQLVYSICPPYQGLDGCCPGLFSAPSGVNANCASPPASCPTEFPPPPYAPIIFLSPYTSSYPIASNPAFSINPTTGMLSGTPSMNGQWVFNICVQEFRNNQLINTHYREFQINVVTCTVAVQSVINDLGTINGGNAQCQGLKIDFVNQSVNQSNAPAYHWDFGVVPINNDTSDLVSPTYTYPDTGMYVVTLISNPGKACSDTAKKLIYIYPPLKINFKAPNAQCLKNNSFNFLVQGLFLPQTTYTWTFGSNATPSISSSNSPTNVVFSQSGFIPITLYAKQFACRDTFRDTIHVIPRPKAKINNLPTILCDPATVAFSNGSSGELPMSYFWQFSNGSTSTAFEPIQVFSPSGVYGVTLTAATNSVCVDTSVVSINNVTVNITPHAAFIFSPQTTTIFDPEIEIDNMASSDVVSWYYLFGDGSSSTYPYEKHIYQDYGDYVIQQTVTNKFGCTDNVAQTVRILPEYRFWMPNAFTPDQNLLNDYFMPIAIGVVNYDFEIFDSWGERIFKTNNPKQGWNGFYKGQECKEGVYVWRITFKNVVTEKDEVHYGHVTLLKNL
jgi:gliding motility-associated-like protein